MRRIALLAGLPAAFVFALGAFISQPAMKTNAPSHAAVSAERLEMHVRKLSEEFSPRNFSQPRNLALAAEYLRSSFSQTRAAVTNQFYEAEGRTYENVLALFPGESPERIVVGAHYDSFGDTPGADDNASGTAGLIELAALLDGYRPKHTIELAAYCTEEPPFFCTEHMGSMQHAQKLSRDGVKVRAMLALEMIGFFTDRPRSQLYPALIFRLFYPAKGNFIAVVGDLRQRRLIAEAKAAMAGATDLPVYSACLPAVVPGVDYSDHRSFRHYGFPAVMITDTAYLRNFEYHQTGDTAERLDYRRMAKTVAAVFEAVKKLDE